MRDWQVINGDSLEVLRRIPSDALDALVTDPPAGIGFMGKEWDSDKGGRGKWIEWLQSVLAEALRVLKPGAHGLIWAIPRTSHWAATAAELAGFEVRDVIDHHFGTGFPKSLNISKAIDQSRTEDEEPVRVVCRALRRAIDAVAGTIEVSPGAVVAKLAQIFECNTRLIEHWAARDTDSQPNLPTPEQWARLRTLVPFASDEGAWLDVEVARLNARKGERGDTWKAAEVVGEHEGVTPGFVGERFDAVDKTIREPSAAAAQWAGWGTALKPATEHWILVRKPLADTVAGNVQAHGTGGLNVNACRIGMDEDDRERARVPQPEIGTTPGNVLDFATGTGRNGETFEPAEGGRWPANLVLSHSEWCEPLDAAGAVVAADEYGDPCAAVVAWRCLPGCPVALLDAQSGTLRGGGYPPEGGTRTHGSTYGKPGKHGARKFTATEGGASRFFYCAKPNGKEREEGLDHMPKRTGGEMVERAEGSAGINNPRAGAGRTSKGRANFHPTVKALGLMSWLVKLITPPGGVVLDPFCGSGSTGCAAMLGGWDFLGIEKDPDFVRIAEARIAHYAAKAAAACPTREAA
jgi:hypothetical protein